MHRTSTIASALLLGSALIACPDASAQQAGEGLPPGTLPAVPTQPAPTAATEPTATTTIVLPAEQVVPAKETVPSAQAVPAEQPVVTAPAATAPTASTTIIDVPGHAVATPPEATTTATIVVPATPGAAPEATASTTPGGEVIDPATYQKRTEFDNTPWRFNMEQNGKRMTADEFAAWMEARGVRVAKGPKAHAPANRTTDGMPAPGSAMPAGAGRTVTLAAAGAPAAPVAAPVAAPAEPGALQPGSVTPTDAWTGTTPPPAPTASTTVTVPVPPVDAEPLPAVERGTQ